MTKKIQRAAAVAVGCLVCACAHARDSKDSDRLAALRAGPKPEWVDSQSMEYPRERYLTGVGQADDRPSAEDRARGQISKIFSAQVTVNTTVSATESAATANGKTDNKFSQAISDTVQTASSKALEGVQIVEDWQDPTTRGFYALAVLDRAKAAESLRDRIADIDRQAKQWKDQLDQSTEKLARVRAALKALAVLKGRAELDSELRVVSADGKGITPAVDEATLRPQAAKALAELDVDVNVSGGGDQIVSGIVRGLSGFGLQAKAGGTTGTGDILVEGKVVTNAVQSGADERWKWARSTATLALKDGHAGKIFLQFDSSDRQASSDYEEAVRRTQVSLGKKVAAQIQDAIASYFENQ